jgi:hypothetical protein
MNLSTDSRTIDKAKVMAEEFALAKTTEMLERFLRGSGLLAEEYADYLDNIRANKPNPEKDALLESELLDLLIEDYRFAFGQELALAYAFGAIDHAEQVATNAYRNAKPVPREESSAQLTLPGFLEE